MPRRSRSSSALYITSGKEDGTSPTLRFQEHGNNLKLRFGDEGLLCGLYARHKDGLVIGRVGRLKFT